MAYAGLVLLLIALFLGIGKAADLVIVNVKSLGLNLGIRQFWLGITLGVLTTMPELFVGLQATFQGVGQLSFGNLVGGVMVLLGLIAGLSVIANREVEVSASFLHYELFALGVYVTLPMWLAADGRLSTLDGLLLMLAYAGIITYFILANRTIHPAVRVEGGTSNLKAFLWGLVGLVVVIILARFILELALPLAEHFGIPPFLTGVLFFSIGTNLPELTLAFRSWQSKARDLSFGNLVGSAFANGLVIGFLGFIRPIDLAVGTSFWILAAFLVFLMASFVYFAYTDRKLTWREGAVLLAIYLSFAFGEVYFKWL